MSDFCQQSVPSVPKMPATIPLSFAAFSGFSIRRNCARGTRLRWSPHVRTCTNAKAHPHMRRDTSDQPSFQALRDHTLVTEAPERGKTLILVGLGNTGPRYDNTRHNIGFALVDEFTNRNGSRFSTERRFHADVAKVQLSDHTIHVVKPRTFMNNSGVAVKAVQKYYNLPTSALLIVTDDMSLGVGRIRLRAKGTAGGHNGLKSVQKSIGTTEYARLKVGVGSPDGSDQWKDFVLGPFSRTEQAALQDVTWDVMDILEHWVQEPELNRVISSLGMTRQRRSR